MDLRQPLEQLVTRVPGSLGAALIDNDGEAITFYVRSDSSPLNAAQDRIRLISAYHRIWLSECVGIARRLQLGEFGYLMQKYESGCVLIKALKGNHALVLVGSLQMYFGQGIFHLNEICEAINEDL